MQLGSNISAMSHRMFVTLYIGVTGVVCHEITQQFLIHFCTELEDIE